MNTGERDGKVTGPSAPLSKVDQPHIQAGGARVESRSPVMDSARANHGRSVPNRARPTRPNANAAAIKLNAPESSPQLVSA